ncbi:MAG: FecR domain-containing protein, partial [Syntrophobacteraceae bacterium]|nr:FecR domain-containing protein [Syntrophobacteraceae bacterium]
MNRTSRLAVTGFLCLGAILTAWTGLSIAGEKTKVLIGRVSHVEGQLLRYVYEEKDWAAVGKDSPFGLEDALYTDLDGRGELMLPNGIWIRIGGSTQVQLVKLKPDLTEIDVAAGVARFHNRGEDGVIMVTSPFGYVVAYGDTVFDMYVGDESVEVIAVTGTVEFVHQGDDSRYEVVAGSTSVIADARQIVAAEGTVDADWDDWNLGRDDLWAKRVEVKGDSIEYLPANLRDDAHAFEENGRWEKIYHEGEYRTMWRPTRVSAGWAPYTSGRWSVYYGDNCWIPDEPFGYATHHYGNWVRVDSCSCWYWMPPRVRRVATHVSYDWYEDYDWSPGRVGWVHREDYVGWVPLAPAEPYYSHRYWGATSILVSTLPQVNINIGGYRYLDNAVIVNHNHFYGVNNYSSVRVTNINKTTIVNNYHSSAVVNNTVINNYNNIRERYHTTNVMVSRAPHDSVVRRIERNHHRSRETAAIGVTDLERNLSRTREGRISREGRIGRPEVTNRLVDRGDRGKPDSDVQFTGKRNLIRNARQIQDSPEGGTGRGGRRTAGFGRTAQGDGPRDGSVGAEGRGRDRLDRPGRNVGVQGGHDDGQVEGGRERHRPGRVGRGPGEGAAGEETAVGGPQDRGRRVRPERGVETGGVEA